MSVFKCITWTTRLDKILDEVQPGDMVQFHRGLFIHHAIYVGRGRAVHHHLGQRNGEVIEATLEYLAKNDLMKVCRIDDTPFSKSEIVDRARSQIGPLPYSLHGGNCEHFTTWVYYGFRLSKQLINLGPYQLKLLQVVKHNPNTDIEVQQESNSSKRSSNQESFTMPEHRVNDSNTSSRPNIAEQIADENGMPTNFGDTKTGTDEYDFVPPRPPKYRPAKNGAELALKHTRSFLKVLSIQALVRLAAVPLHRCGLQADNLRRIGRQLTGKSAHSSTDKTNDKQLQTPGTDQNDRSTDTADS